MSAYERRYGVLAEGCLNGWHDTEDAAEITAETFELIWVDARQHLDAFDAAPAQEVTT
jgi:hypothetical protein